MQSQWFESFFQGPAVEFWNRVIRQQLTITEVDWLEKHLGLTSQAKVLDVPCGDGRHSIELARRGHRVTGIDLSDEFLDLARRTQGVEWRKGDMRSLELPSNFYDAAFCLGNSFGYLDNVQAAAFLTRVAQSLRAGGRLAIDAAMTAEIVFDVLRQRWHQSGDLYVLSNPTYVPEVGRIDIAYTFLQGGVADLRHSSSYVFTSRELVSMLTSAGFSSVALHGDLQGTPFRLGSERLWIVAIK